MPITYTYLCSQGMPMGKGRFCDTGEQTYCVVCLSRFCFVRWWPFRFCFGFLFFYLKESSNLKLLWWGRSVASHLVEVCSRVLLPFKACSHHSCMYCSSSLNLAIERVLQNEYCCLKVQIWFAAVWEIFPDILYPCTQFPLWLVNKWENQCPKHRRGIRASPTAVVRRSVVKIISNNLQCPCR